MEEPSEASGEKAPENAEKAPENELTESLAAEKRKSGDAEPRKSLESEKKKSLTDEPRKSLEGEKKKSIEGEPRKSLESEPKKKSLEGEKKNSSENVGEKEGETKTPSQENVARKSLEGEQKKSDENVSGKSSDDALKKSPEDTGEKKGSQEEVPEAKESIDGEPKESAEDGEGDEPKKSTDIDGEPKKSLSEEGLKKKSKEGDKKSVGKPIKKSLEPELTIQQLRDPVFAKNEIEKRQVEINELKQRYEELTVESDYALKRKDMTYQEEIKHLNNNFNTEIAQLKTAIEELDARKEGNMEAYNTYLLEVRDAHQGHLDNMEAHFNTKLISEYEKYNSLQVLLEHTIKDYEERVAKMESDGTQATEEMLTFYESQVTEKAEELEDAYDDAKIQLEETEEMKRQIEEDADQEILELTTSYERHLKHERDINGKLKGEVGIMNKRFVSMQKEIQERITECTRLDTECLKLSNTITEKERDIVKLQKQLVDSEAANGQKEKSVSQLQKGNNELEKLKFVLEHRIKELRKTIEPKDREIIYLKQQNTDMESELDSTIGMKNDLQLKVSQLQNRLNMADHQAILERRKVLKLQVILDGIRSSMTRCMSVLHDHKFLKATVQAMYKKYGQTNQFGKATSSEQETICELVRQKQHLEVSLTSIKRKLAKDAQFTRTEQLKIMHENMLLVYEINHLREELKQTRDKIMSYETSLGFNQSANPSEAAELRFKLQHAIEDRDDLDIQQHNAVEGKNAVIDAQQEEIDSLSTKILKVHEYVHDTSRPDNATAAEHIRNVLGPTTEPM